MPVRYTQLISATLNTASETAAATHNFLGVVPTRVSLYVRVVETQDNGNPTTTLTVELSPDRGQTLISYDKLLTDAGTDAPAASAAYTSTVDDVVSLSPEDVTDYIRVLLTGSADMDAGDFHVVTVWLAYAYTG